MQERGGVLEGVRAWVVFVGLQLYLSASGFVLVYRVKPKEKQDLPLEVQSKALGKLGQIRGKLAGGG